jgi:hypothetical protein
MKLYRPLLWIQGLYMLTTGLWPIFHLKSFLDVTGYKTDAWLVVTVGVLLIPVSLTLLSFLFLKSNILQAILLGGATALAFAIVDFYYAMRNVVPDIYMLDGAAEIVFLGGWIYIALSLKKDTTAH